MTFLTQVSIRIPVRDKAMLDFIKTKAKSCHGEDTMEERPRDWVDAWLGINDPVLLKFPNTEL